MTETTPLDRLLRRVEAEPPEDFTPTPPRLAYYMAQVLVPQTGELIMDPVAGVGALLAAVRETGIATTLHYCERDPLLQEILRLRGFDRQPRVGHNFTVGFPVDQDYRYDGILMHPPFRQGQDMALIRRAYDWLSPRGRLIAVCSDAAFSKRAADAGAFRFWLAELGGEVEPLPVGTIMEDGVDTRARLVIIDK